MYLRDLECCADGMAFSSTPSDLVQFALETDHGTLHGELAGGQVRRFAPASGSPAGTKVRGVSAA
jgi:hypothetical protein